jgi:acyl dehydratase
VTREDVRAYAEASGDRNPLHLDDGVARSAGFEGVIAHGMFTMGHLASAVGRWLGEDAFVRRMRVQFRAPVFVGETIVARATVRDVDGRVLRLDASVTVDRDGAIEQAVRRAELEVVLPDATDALGRGGDR